MAVIYGGLLVVVFSVLVHRPRAQQAAEARVRYDIYVSQSKINRRLFLPLSESGSVEWEGDLAHT